MLLDRKSRSIEPEEAGTLAARSLGYLASDPELLARFLALSGIEATEIRQAAREPGFLAGVLGFFLAHEPSLLKLCEALEIVPEDVQAAARALPSGDDQYERST